MIVLREQDPSDGLSISISRSFVFREWLKPVVGKPAEAGWKAAEIACFHQLKRSSGFPAVSGNGLRRRRVAVPASLYIDKPP